MNEYKRKNMVLILYYYFTFEVPNDKIQRTYIFEGERLLNTLIERPPLKNFPHTTYTYCNW